MPTGQAVSSGALIGVLAVSVGALVMSVACSRPGVEIAHLAQTLQIDDGHPAYLSEDAGLRMLLALSSDGRSVTPVASLR
ncbi:hypothetical protein MAHJHV51_56950 [Mycobacterium avium subsp. hominissuis]